MSTPPEEPSKPARVTAGDSEAGSPDSARGPQGVQPRSRPGGQGGGSAVSGSTTAAANLEGRPDDLVERIFQAPAPNRLRVAHPRYVSTDPGSSMWPSSSTAAAHRGRAGLRLVHAELAIGADWRC